MGVEWHSAVPPTCIIGEAEWLSSLLYVTPLCQPVKKNLPSLTRLTTMQAGSGRHNVRQSFGAEIVAPMKRNALHFEKMRALLACRKGVDALAVCAPLKRRG